MNGSFTVIWLKSKKSKILSYEFFYSKKKEKKKKLLLIIVIVSHASTSRIIHRRFSYPLQ